jgi:hypothetical protein
LFGFFRADARLIWTIFWIAARPLEVILYAEKNEPEA